MHFTGLLGMPRRVYTYDANQGYDSLNMMSTVGAIIMGLATLILVYNIMKSRKGGQKSGNNPWGAGTLEWSMSSPPPPYNFAKIPLVTSRYPLWDLAGHAPGESIDLERLDQGPGTRIPTADQLGIVLPYDTVKPLFAAIGLVAMFCGLMLTRRPSPTFGYAVIFCGFACLVGSLYWWATSPLEPEVAHH
jgi:hypothetical protein